MGWHWRRTYVGGVIAIGEAQGSNVGGVVGVREGLDSDVSGAVGFLEGGAPVGIGLGMAVSIDAGRSVGLA